MYLAFIIDGIKIYRNTKERDFDTSVILVPLNYHYTFSEDESFAGEAGIGFDVRALAQKMGFLPSDRSFADIRNSMTSAEAEIVIGSALREGLLDPSKPDGGLTLQ